MDLSRIEHAVSELANLNDSFATRNGEAATEQGGFVLRPFASPARELPEIVDFFPVS